MSKRTKIVLLVDDYSIERWMYLALERVMNAGHSDIVLIVKNESSGIYKNRWRRLFSNRHKVVYFCYQIIESMISRILRGESARKMMPICDLLPNVKKISVKPIEGKYTDKFAPSALQDIKEFDPDIIVRFGFRILKGGILDIAKHGVWSYHHGDPNMFRGGPACYWESVFRTNKTGSILQVLSDDLDGGTVLQKGYTATNIYSPFLNYENAMLSSTSFLEDAIRSVGCNGCVNVPAKPLLYYDGKIYKAPSNIPAMKHLLLFTKRILARFLEKMIWFDQWTILYGPSDESNIRKLTQFKPKNRDRFWADPFLFKEGDRNFIFFEEQIGNEPAHIAVGEVINCELTNINIALAREYHLSYPYIFRFQDSIYMVPESSGNKSVDLYRTECFPNKWVKVRTILNNVEAADATILFKDGLWWLFVSIRECVGSCPHSSLRLFYTRDLLHGEFIPHTKNPICSDISQSRPAGRPFYLEGKLFRPSQDCSIRYGYGLNINLVNELSKSQYDEVVVQQLKPNWSDECMAMHTYNSDGNQVVMDAQMRRRRFFNL